VLQAGGAGLFGTSLSTVLSAESLAVARPGRAKSVMFLFLYGGPSQLETFDMKPDAASTIRGPYQPIPCRTPDLLICEHLPKLAACSDKYAVIRTLGHPQNDHNGTHYIQTGHTLPPANRGSANVDAADVDWPAYGSVVEYLDQKAAAGAPRAMPSYVYLPKRLGHFAGYDINGQYAGWLGKAYNGIATNINKRAADDNPYFRDCTDDELDFRIQGLDPQPDLTLDRFARRESLREQFETERRRLEAAATVKTFDSTRGQALNLLTSPQIAEAFDVRREPDALRDRYGRNLWGQSVLLGRRLIEAGARFVTVAWDLAVRGDVMGSWDMHAGLTTMMKKHFLPGLDVSLTALLEDLESRGLLDETLVVAVGEMGRTPKFENRGQSDGRDHWSYCFPCVLAGAGIRGGVVYGKSDKDAAWPIERPVTCEDLACTIYEALGIDPHAFIPDKLGRPVSLIEGGRALTELFS
jgi:hypothetical protein